MHVTDPQHRWNSRSDQRDDIHYPTRPVDKEKAEAELTLNIKKATSPEEGAPKSKHVRSMSSNSISPYPLNTERRQHRMHRVHLGLSFVDINLVWTPRTAHLVR